MLANVKVVEIPYGKRKGFHVKQGREFLSGPFKSKKEAKEATKEWMVVKYVAMLRRKVVYVGEIPC